MRAKEEGNGLFRGKQWKEAVRCWNKGLELFGLSRFSAPPYVDFDEPCTQEQSQVKIALLSNSSECYLRMGNYEQAFKHAAAALYIMISQKTDQIAYSASQRLSLSVPPIKVNDPKSACKALLRLSKAAVALDSTYWGNLDQHLSDIEQLCEQGVQPDCRSEVQRLRINFERLQLNSENSGCDDESFAVGLAMGSASEPKIGCFVRIFHLTSSAHLDLNRETGIVDAIESGRCRVVVHYFKMYNADDPNPDQIFRSFQHGRMVTRKVFIKPGNLEVLSRPTDKHFERLDRRRSLFEV